MGLTGAGYNHFQRLGPRVLFHKDCARKMKKTLHMLVALAVACGTAAIHAQEVQGNVQAGEQKNAMCIGCHGIVGYQSSFPEVHKVPMISGQNAAYLASALQAYLKGERKHPTMRGVAISLTEQDIADLSAYYAQHGKSGTELPAAPKRQPDARAFVKAAQVHGHAVAESAERELPDLYGVQHGVGLSRRAGGRHVVRQIDLPAPVLHLVPFGGRHQPVAPCGRAVGAGDQHIAHRLHTGTLLEAPRGAAAQR